MTAPRPVRGVLLATLTAVLWGTVPVAGKIALGGISAPAPGAVRLGAAVRLVEVPGMGHTFRGDLMPPMVKWLEEAFGLGK